MKVSQGFSLLEILVVLLIIGLFSALSVAWLDSGHAPMLQALEKLAAEARTQAAQARHSGQVSGMRWNGRQPEFVRKDQTRWIVDTSPMTSWPEGLKADWPVSDEPRVIFTPSGVATAVNLNWHWPEGRQRWEWRTDNSLTQVKLP
ncbi:prepilin-type N-terminal cleavage/methylation domain-containing protein [Pseudomonas cichorii]|uniref:prepilin-type N-terminal cleavage/methylation domain-containing protein n=1 Tax=Pseudomonas cichorii TaxID=36746 RepID=UPI001C8A95D7|nr:prepilin-type N-terminal cleavage/methylation domain-containing protein [Pseudomonas cichorii]MBX8498091.1 prepilin-type N-terminal cleavage/methylation domain-containing protein [Pseudomonas cichorii]